MMREIHHHGGKSAHNEKQYLIFCRFRSFPEVSVDVCLSFQMLTSVRKILAKTVAAAQTCEQTTPASVPANTWGGTVSTVSENRLHHLI